MMNRRGFIVGVAALLVVPLAVESQHHAYSSVNWEVAPRGLRGLLRAVEGTRGPSPPPRGPRRTSA